MGALVQPFQNRGMTLGPVLHLYPLTCIAGGIRGQTLHSLTSYVVGLSKIVWYIVHNFELLFNYSTNL
jgi:hypothetical protein